MNTNTNFQEFKVLVEKLFRITVHLSENLTAAQMVFGSDEVFSTRWLSARVLNNLSGGGVTTGQDLLSNHLLLLSQVFVGREMWKNSMRRKRLVIVTHSKESKPKANREHFCP